MIFRLPTQIKDIGPSLKELRIRLGVRQQDLVEAGVGTQGTLSALENGHKMPLFSTVLDYLAFLGCALDVTRLNGEDIPEARSTKGPNDRKKVYTPRPYVYRPRKSRANLQPESPRNRSAGTTSTGRCLSCFRNHTTEQGDFCL